MLINKPLRLPILISSIFILCLLVPSFYLGKLEFHQFTNQFHAPFFDYFFTYITKLVELPVIGVIIIAAILKPRWTLISLLSFGFATLIVYLLKTYVFYDVYRPIYHIPSLRIHLHEDVINIKKSFPSGHTTSAFALFGFLSLSFKNKVYTFLTLAFALLIGISRIYLSQHFAVDVAAGAFIGMFVVVLTFKFSKGFVLKGKR